MTKSLDLKELNKRFEKAEPEEILGWAISEFRPALPCRLPAGRQAARQGLAMTSSFQTESVVLLHMVSNIDPSIPILFLETGWHFQETLDFKRELIQRLKLTNVTDLKADPNKREASIKDSHGKPYEEDPDRCCYINKVEPLQKALKNYEAWISGIRRSQSKTREDIAIVEEYENGLIKINPLANLTSGDIWWYIREHSLPKHPLFDKGYLSIGCWPCTRPVQPGDDERSGRWAGLAKAECGIHTVIKPKEARSKPKVQTGKEEGSGI